MQVAPSSGSEAQTKIDGCRRASAGHPAANTRKPTRKHHEERADHQADRRRARRRIDGRRGERPTHRPRARRSAAIPVQTLPEVNPPPQAPSVTVQVEHQSPQLQQLLARPLTPSKIQIEGVKALPFDDIARRFTPIGRARDDDRPVDRDRQRHHPALPAARLCALVRLRSAQDFADGVVKVTVVEGFVAKVQISGDAGNDEGQDPRDRRAYRGRPAAAAPYLRALHQCARPAAGREDRRERAAADDHRRRHRARSQVERKRFDFNMGLDLNHPGRPGAGDRARERRARARRATQRLGPVSPRGATTSSTTRPISPRRSASDGLTGKLNASHYQGEPTDNPGLAGKHRAARHAGQVRRRPRLPVPAVEPAKLVGTLNAYGTHDEDRYTNTITGALVGLKSNVRVLQPQVDYADSRDGMSRKASFFVSKAFDILGASKSGFTNVPGVTQQSSVDIDFFKVGGSVTQSNTWPFGFGTTFSVHGPVQPRFAADLRADHLRRPAFRARLRAGRSGRRFGLGRLDRIEPRLHARLYVSANRAAVYRVRHGAGLPQYRTDQPEPARVHRAGPALRRSASLLARSGARQARRRCADRKRLAQPAYQCELLVQLPIGAGSFHRQSSVECKRRRRGPSLCSMVPVRARRAASLRFRVWRVLANPDDRVATSR